MLMNPRQWDYASRSASHRSCPERVEDRATTELCPNRPVRGWDATPPSPAEIAPRGRRSEGLAVGRVGVVRALQWPRQGGATRCVAGRLAGGGWHTLIIF